MIKYLYLIGFILTSYIATLNFNEVVLDYEIINNGKIIEAKILKVPEICFGKNNRIEVVFNNISYSLLISSNNCIDNKYSVGQSIQVYFEDDVNKREYKK